MQRRVRGRRLGAWGALAVCMVPAVVSVGVSSDKQYVRALCVAHVQAGKPSSPESIGSGPCNCGGISFSSCLSESLTVRCAM